MNLRWLQGVADNPSDFCAHGDVEFSINGDVLLGDDTGRDVTVSAAALYLLRMLSSQHTRESPVGDQLFPCCGFTMYDIPDETDVMICGCPSGSDFQVLHLVSGAGVEVRASDGRAWQVAWPVWRAVVFEFADTVADFYAVSAPKWLSAEDAPGFAKFVAEWDRRRGEPSRFRWECVK